MPTHRIMPPQIKADPINSEMFSRVYYKDKNILVLVCGGTGDCKSGSSITKLWELDRGQDNEPRFYVSADPDDPNNRVVTSAQKFVKLISGKLPKGSGILWDEIGIDADNREYYTLKNRLVKKVMQTFRHKNLIVFMTVPDFNSVDIGVRKLVHGYLEMRGQAMKGTMASGKFQWVQTNPKSGKQYFKNPRYRDKGTGIIKKLKVYYIRKPPQELEIPYKKMKEVVNAEWYKRYNVELKYMQDYIKDRDAAKGDSLMELVNMIMKNPLPYYHPIKKRFVAALIEADPRLNMGPTKARKVASLLNVKLARGEIVA